MRHTIVRRVRKIFGPRPSRDAIVARSLPPTGVWRVAGDMAQE